MGSPNATIYESVPNNAAPVTDNEEGDGIMGGRRECIIGTTMGDRKNVVAPDAKAICCVSQELSLLLLSSIILPLLFFRVISLVVLNARSLRLLLLFF